MELYLTEDFLKSNEKIIGRFNLVFPELKSLQFDGEFYRFRDNDAEHGFDGFVYGGNDLSLTYANFQKKSTRDFFNSNNGDFWLSGTDLAENFKGQSGMEMCLAETTEEQGFNFGTKLINAYNSEVERTGKALPKGVPNSVVVFDPLVEMIMNPLPYLKGMSQAESERKEKSPQIYMFAGNMQK